VATGLDLPTLVQKVRVDGDTAQAERQVESSMTRIGGKIKKAGVAASVGLTVPIIAGAFKATQAASDLAESASKVGVVFEGQQGIIRDWAKTAATSMGLSEEAALGAAGTFGNLFRALDVGLKPAAEMSTSLVELASDLASFNNANPEDVLLALRSGLLGEAEPLRQFGVSLSAARIEAEALASGLVKPIANATKVAEAALKVKVANEKAAAALREHGEGSTEYQTAAIAATKAEEAYAASTKGTVPELTAAQKAQAAYAIIQKDTALAQGDFARTSDGLANQQRILAAQFKDTQASLGQILLPTVTKGVKFLNRLLDGFKGLSPEMRKVVVVVGGILAAVGPLLLIVGKLATSVSAITGLFGLFGGAAGGAAVAAEGAAVAGGGVAAAFLPVVAIVAAVAAAGFLIVKNWDKIAPVLKTVAAGAKQLFGVLFQGDFKGGGPFAEDSPVIARVFEIRDALIEFVGFLRTKVLPVMVDVGKNVIEGLTKVISFLSTHVVPHLVEFGSKVIDAVGGAFDFLAAEVIPLISDFASFVVAKVTELKTFWDQTWPQFSEAVGHVFRVVRTVIETVLGILKPLIEGVLGVIAALWRAWGDDIMGFVTTAFETVKSVISGVLQIVQGIIQTVLAVINGDWSKAWDGVVKIFTGAWDVIFALFRGVITNLQGVMGGIVSTIAEFLRPVGNFLHTLVVEPFEGLLDFVGGLPGKITRKARGMWDGIFGAFKAAINKIIDLWNGLEFKIGGKKVFGQTLPGVTIGTPDIPRLALGGRPPPGQAFLAGERGTELVTGDRSSAQVLNADRTQRLLRQIAAGGGPTSSEPGIYAPISVETVDRRSGEQLGRDIAWGLSSGTGRPLVGSGKER